MSAASSFVEIEEEVVRPLQVTHIIVEGDSEENYCNEILSFIREAGVPSSTWNIINARGGGYSNISNAIKKFTDDNPNIPFILWLDDDIVARDVYRNVKESQRNLLNSYKVLYSTHKFEDFLVMHYSQNVLADWDCKCRSFKKLVNDSEVDYVTYPFVRSDYMPVFCKFLSKLGVTYSKGSLPFDFSASTDKNRRESILHFKRLVAAQADKSIFCKCDFIPQIVSILQDAEISLTGLE